MAVGEPVVDDLGVGLTRTRAMEAKEYHERRAKFLRNVTARKEGKF